MKELKLKLSDFDGPLDLLLTLVRENKMDIEHLDILTIADQYLKFIYSQKSIQINEASEYLLMASTLIWIKSKTVLGSTIKLSEEEQSQIDIEKRKLINQILLYKKYKDLVPKFVASYDARQKLFTKNADDVEKALGKKVEREIFVIPTKISFTALQKAMQAAYDKWRLNLYNNYKLIVQEVSAEQVEKDILQIFKKYPKTTKYSLSDFFMLLDENHLSDQYLVTCFVCLLDLARNGLLQLTQNHFDDEIYIEILKGANHE